MNQPHRNSLFLVVAMMCVWGSTVASPPLPKFQSEFKTLLKKFEGALADEASAKALLDSADQLYDEARDYRRENRKSLSKEESSQLRDFYTEVRDFKGAVRVIGQLHNAASTDIDDLDRVISRLGLKATVMQTFSSGLELVRIDVGTFGSVLLRNPSKTNYVVVYSVNDPESSGGAGSAKCEDYSVLSGLFNSRDRRIEGLKFEVNATALSAASCD